MRERLTDPSSEVTDSKPAALRAEVTVLPRELNPPVLRTVLPRESGSPSLTLLNPVSLNPPVLATLRTVLLRENGSPSLTLLTSLNPPVLRVEVARDMADSWRPTRQTRPNDESARPSVCQRTVKRLGDRGVRGGGEGLAFDQLGLQVRDRNGRQFRRVTVV